MTKLSKHVRCISPCMRGFGYSSYVNKIESFKDLAQDLKLFINENLKLDSFYVSGHQMGGCVALELAYLMPKKCLGIVNFSMFPLTGLKVPGYKIETMKEIK